MTILRLVPLTLGWQELDRCIALDGYPPGEGDRIPIPGWVIERDGGGLILYDTGYDPEVSAFSNTDMRGVDLGSYPQSRLFTLGMSVTF